MDELPEFHRDVREALRQPIEDGVVTVSRAAGTVTYPSRFMLVCAMNPCKCGWYGHPTRRCTCSETEIRRYHARVSGPLLDRIDIMVEVPALDYAELSGKAEAEPSSEIKSAWTPPEPASAPASPAPVPTATPTWARASWRRLRPQRRVLPPHGKRL